MSQPFPAEILLVPVGDIASEVLSQLCYAIESTFEGRCTVGASLPVPDSAYDPRRSQYSAGAILKKLPRKREGRVLGVADLDLFVPELNFVFGLSEPSGGR